MCDKKAEFKPVNVKGSVWVVFELLNRTCLSDKDIKPRILDTVSTLDVMSWTLMRLNSSGLIGDSTRSKPQLRFPNSQLAYLLVSFIGFVASKLLNGI